MAEFTFKSAGVATREIDLSAPAAGGPVGVPAGTIGTSDKGPAFVPVTVANFVEFSQKFGNTDGEKFGPLAVYEWLKNAQAATYIRVLGIGDGNKRDNSSGVVTNAGFVVGAKQVQQDGNIGSNPYSVGDDLVGPPGRTHFLGAFMSESNGCTMFTEAGIRGIAVESGSMAILRGVLFAASGVVPMLSGNHLSGAPSDGTEASASGPTGSITGSVNIQNGLQEFVMILNGLKSSTNSSNILTASFDPTAKNYFANVFNTDPLKTEEKGHLLYAHYDIYPARAALTGVGVFTHVVDISASFSSEFQDVAYLTTGSLSRNGGSSTAPNYEDFQDRFTHAKSPFVVSQGDINGYDLFRFHALDAGSSGNTKVKVSIENLKKSTSAVNLFGSFDVVVRDFYDTDDNKRVLEQYRGLSLDRNSDRFIARVIGDQNIHFDFDQSGNSQRLVVEGDYPTVSNYIRVEQSTALKAGSITDESLPVGFRGPHHLVTSGTDPLTDMLDDDAGSDALAYGDTLRRTVEPPVPYRENLTIGTGIKKRTDSKFYWGIQFEQKESITEPNKSSKFNRSMESYVKYFPTHRKDILNFSVGNNPAQADSGGTVLDCDKFNNNFFSLERVRVRTGSAYDGLADPSEWHSASYIREGSIAVDSDSFYRAWKVGDLEIPGNRKYSKFTLFLQGGFDGLRIFDKQKQLMSNVAVKREMDDSNQGQTDGPTVAAYRKAVDIMGAKSDVDIQILTIPGLRHTAVTDYAIDAIENRFDAIYLMDIQERDNLNNVITSSYDQQVSVSNTITDFKNRSLDTSFAAAYFPDVVVQDPTTLSNVTCPPSVAVLGAFSYNDSVGYPWFAPAGFTRGALSAVDRAAVYLNRDNLDNLYDADINPLTAFPGTGVVVWGQKTLQAAESSLDRINVRRLLIDIRRSVRAVANTLLFEPNRAETLDRFTSLVNPILQSVQERSGLDRFKVIIDTSTTTQADVENNTLRGKIFLQPTRTAEFIALDFVVTNAGAEV